MTQFIFTTSIERGDDEIDVRVVYDVSPIIPARLYGDYPQPAEGGEVEIIKAEFVGVGAASMPSPLTDAEYEALQDEAEARAQSDLADEAADRADWRYQEYRDRQLMREWDR